MARQTFTWSPDEGASASVTPSVETTKFGDGYQQRVRKGINGMPQIWSVEFTANIATSQQIKAFLETHEGALSFDWVTPISESGVYVCKEWSMAKVAPAILKLTANFEQVFEV